MNQTPETSRGWRILRRILLVLAVLATLIAALYTEEDWRGKRAWENYKHELEAKGEKLDWQAFVPPSVPNNQNFFTAPIFTNMRDGKVVMLPYGNDAGPAFRPGVSRSGYAIYRMYLTDLEAWQNYYRNPTTHHAVVEMFKTNGVMIVQTNDLQPHAIGEFPTSPQSRTPAKDVLLALSKYDSAIEELRQASQRPYANVPLNYADGFNTAGTLLPYLATLKRCTQTLQLRAAAELADGQSQNALEDVKLTLYLSDSLRHSPFLISYLVRIAVLATDLQPIWEGLADHQWSDGQLASLEAELGKVDVLADYEFTMRAERAFAIAAIENERRTRELVSYTGNRYATNNLTLAPSAFFYQNELAFARMNQQWILPLVDANARRVTPEALERVNVAVQAARKHYSPYTVQALMTFPALATAVRKFASAQTAVDLARVACALERYRLAHGEYPESLDVLSPQFIEKVPHDIINGQPLLYRRETNGQFILYSVGWNEKDDSGTVALTRSGSADLLAGDWVWQYPTK